MDEDAIKDSIFYICVTSVFLCWSITSYYENIEELKNQRELFSDAFEKGYIQCVENNKINSTHAKVVWKKQCEEK